MVSMTHMMFTRLANCILISDQKGPIVYGRRAIKGDAKGPNGEAGTHR
jgi:hypothetical protein